MFFVYVLHFGRLVEMGIKMCRCKCLIQRLTFKAPITTAADNIHKYFFNVFQRKDLIFHVNPLLGRGFTQNIKPYFLQNIKVKK